MASHRRPKGVYIRNTPDWRTDALAYGGTQYPDPGGAFQTFSTISLYNNDQTGRAFQVYFISAFWDGASIILADLFYGTFGSFAASCSPISPSMANPPGQIFLRTDVVVGNAPNPNPITPTLYLGLGFASAGIGFSAPLVIVPQGYSLRLVNNIRSAESGATFWYTYLPEMT